MRFVLLLVLSFLSAAAAPAQQQWFVDPVNGDDLLNDGKSTGSAFKSLFVALSVPELSSGDTIFLGGGVYDAAGVGAGGGNNSEVFPLQLKSGVSIVADSVFNPPIFDGAITGGGTIATLAELSEDIVTLTTLDGIQFLNFQTGIVSPGVDTINGLVVQNCSFDNFTQTGINLPLNTGQTDALFAIRGCTFSGAPGQTGINVTVGDGTTLNGGSIEDCTLSNLDIGIVLFCEQLSTIDRDFKVLRNLISDFRPVGLWVGAFGGSSSNSATVRGNAIVGDNNNATSEIGLVIEATNSVGGTSVVETNGWIAYNDISQCNVNLSLDADSNAGQAFILNEFAGNVFRNATSYGVLFQAANQDNPPSIDPDFGGHPQGSGFAGRNTFENASPAFEVGLDPNGNMLFQVFMQHNFWLGDSTTEIFSQIDDHGQLLPSISPILEDTLSGSLVASVIKPNLPNTLTIRLQTGSFVVHVDSNFAPDIKATPGTFGQYRLLTLVGPGGTVTLLPADIVQVIDPGGISSYGKFLKFNVPALTAGNYTINFANSGFQSLAPIGFKVSSTSGGSNASSGGLCVVATAAHGGYDQPQVRVLRSFRDRYLLPYAGGRAMVRSYYRNGTPLAEFIAERRWARGLTRTALAPPTAVAYSLVYWNTGQRFFAGVFLLGLCFALLRRRH